MSKIIILHGTDCKPEDFWYLWAKKKLEQEGHDVLLPYLPEINKTPIAEFLISIMNTYDFNEDTILIGHSAGAPLILSILEQIKAPIKQVVLVAGFSEELEIGVDEPVLQSSYEWAKIKDNAKEFVIFNSPNDPWGCDDKQGWKFFNKLGGTLLIRNDGHFGSSKDPSFKEFPLLLKMIGASK